MATIAELNIRLGLIYKDLDTSLKSVERSLQTSARRLSYVGDAMTLAISAPLAALSVGAIQQAGELESLKLAMRSTFETAGRSIREADAELTALRKSALAPGLDFEQAVRASIRLQGVEYSAESARNTIEQLANAIALTGGTAQNLDGVTVQFAQMIAKGKVLSQDLRIVQENMPIISKLMQEAFGTKNAEALQKMGISGREFVDAITAAATHLPRVEGGIKNAIVNAGAQARQALAELGDAINKAFNVTGLLDKFSNALLGAVEWFKSLSDGAKRLIIEFGLLLIAAGPLLKVFGALYGGVGQLVGALRAVAQMTKPVTLFFSGMMESTSSVTRYVSDYTRAMLGAGQAATKMRVAILAATGGIAAILLGIAAAVYLLSDRFNAAKFAAEEFNKAQKNTIEQAAKETAVLNQNFDILRSVTASTDDRKKAIDELKSVYPGYLKNIDLEKASSAELTQIQKGLNAEIVRGVAERQKAAAVTAIYEKQAQILLRIQQIQRTGDITAGEAGLINTGDWIKAGSRAAAVVEKLKQQVSGLGEQANVTAKDFDKAFGLQARSIDPLLEKEYRARQAAQDARDAIEGYSDKAKVASAETKKLSDSVSSAGDGLSKKMRGALAGVNADLRAFDEALKLSGPSADSAQEKNELLSKSINRLLKAGFSATSEQVQRLNAQLNSGSQITEDARQAYLKLREEWSKPAEINLPKPAVQTIQQANPLGVGALYPAPEFQSPSDVLSISAINDSLLAINALTAGLQNLNSAGLTPMQALMDGIEGRTISFSEAWSAAGEVISESGRMIQSAVYAAADAIYQSAASGAKGFGDLARAALSAAAKIIRAEIQTGVASAISKALKFLPFPFNLAGGAVAGAVAAALFNKAISAIGIPALAEGGVIKKPTFALLGEYGGASGNAEIVAPENKLRSIFRESSSGDSGALVAVVRGDDLQFILDRAAARRARRR